MQNRFLMRIVLVSLVVGVIGAQAARPAVAASVNINLDGSTTNGAESNVSLNVMTTSPVKIKNTVTNKAVGQSFQFSWPGAGPGGFASQVAAGTTTGKGAIWTWETVQQVYAITGSINFTRSDGTGSSTFTGIPGRSLSSSGVTTTNASLTSSLIVFFSPPQELVRVTSSVEQLGYGFNKYSYSITNFTPDELTYDWSPGPISPVACDTGYCGNDVRQSPEQCDGPDLGGQACTDLGYSGGILGCSRECTYDTSLCTGEALCGNGEIDPYEECDGSNLGERSCASFEYYGGTLGCTEGCTFDFSGCYDGYCGDGSVTPNEQCDGSNLNGATCVSRGYLYGTLSCNQDCNYDESGCTNIGLAGGSRGAGAPALNARTVQTKASRNGSAFPVRTPPTRGAVAVGAAPFGEGAVPCEFPGFAGKVTSDPPTTRLFCRISPHPAKELTSQIVVCGTSIPQGPPGCGSGLGTQGTAEVLVPDETITIGGIYLSTYLIEVADGSDGRAEPGETTDLFISLINGGSQGLIGSGASPVMAHLEVAPGDYNGDGTLDTVLPVVTRADAAYPDIEPAGDVVGDCDTLQMPLHPVRNLTPFAVRWPTSPTDVAYQFNLVVTGQPFGFSPVPSFTVPLVIGVGSGCDSTSITGQFDEVQGLLPPMGPLVPAENDVTTQDLSGTESPTRPLKMKILCGGKQLTGKDGVSPPEIIRLTRNGTDVDLTKLYLDVNSNANDHSLLFRYAGGGSGWIYNLNTNAIGHGEFTVYIKMPNGQPYKSSFAIK